MKNEIQSHITCTKLVVLNNATRKLKTIADTPIPVMLRIVHQKISAQWSLYKVSNCMPTKYTYLYGRYIRLMT